MPQRKVKAMNRRQHYLFEMLKEIDSICKKHGIQYFLVGGSLIGALRNEGFLPWDDDADICMTYDNYLRFKEACRDGLPANRALIAPELQEECGVMIARYTSCDTTLIHTAQSLHRCTAGEVIDVFVLDPVADDEEALRGYIANVCMVHEMCNYASITANRYEVPYETYLKYAAIKKRDGQLAVCQQLEEEKRQFFDEEGSRYVFRWQGCMISYPRSWFASSVDVVFEGYTFPGPVGFNEYLTAYFGEEWAELPGNINPAKHNASASLDFPSSQALEYFKPSQDQDKLRERMWERKRLVLETSAQVNRFKDEVAAAQAKLIELELEEHLSAVGEQFDEAYAARDGRALAGILRDYLRAQCDRGLIGRHAYDDIYRFNKPVLADVPDRVFEAALWALMETERIRFAHRLIEIREQQGRELSAAMAEVKQAIKLFRTACNCCSHGELDKALLTATINCKRHPRVSAFLKLVCVLLSRANTAQPSEEALSKLQRAVEAGRERYPWDGFFLKMEADIIWDEGRIDDARALYLSAAESTRNGFALLDIKKKTGYWPRWMRESSWGKEYGIPAWEGEEPSQLLPAPPKIAVPCAPQSPQDYLYALLKDLAQLCDRLKIPYRLAPEAHSALMHWGCLPGQISHYAIVCGKSGAEKIATAVKQGALPGCSVERSTSSATGSPDDALYIHKGSSVYLNMATVLTRAENSLYVSVRLEPDKDSSKPRSSLGLLMRRLKKQLMPGSELSSQVKTASDKISGAQFKVAEGAASKLKRPADTLKLGPNELVSTVVSAAAFDASGAVPADYFSRKRELRPKTSQIAAALRDFRANFKEVKLAVQLKQLSLELLPKKAEILRMREEGDLDGVAAALHPYAKLVRSFKGVGDPCFDQELFDALQECEQRAGH